MAYEINKMEKIKFGSSPIEMDDLANKVLAGEKLLYEIGKELNADTLLVCEWFKVIPDK